MRNMKMLRTERGSPDGAHVFTYEKGTVYALPDELAGIFEKEGWAKEAAAEPTAAAPARADGPPKADGTAGPDFTRLKKADLKAIALNTFGKALADSLTKDEMVAELEKLHDEKAKASGDSGENAGGSAVPPTGTA